MVNQTKLDSFSAGLHENTTQLSMSVEPAWASLSLVIIILFTVCGNSLVCIAVIRERHLQNTTNYFLTSLAFTDCLVACLVMPLAVAIELIGHFPLNALACNVWSTFDVCCSTSSIWHMSVMSLDRYLTLRYPLKYGRNKRRSLMAYKIITIWLISFAICLPLFILGLMNSSNVYDETTRSCFPSHRAFKIYGSCVAFFIPLLIMIITYALTMSALQQAHTTKKKRYSRRQKMHAVINLATMAMRWKRAVNNEPNSTDNKTSDESAVIRPEHIVHNPKLTSALSNAHRKRASSLLETEPRLATSKHFSKRIFVSNSRLHETSKLVPSMNFYKQREKALQPLPEKSIEQSSPMSNRHLDPDSISTPTNSPAKRSHSCTPLLNVTGSRKDRRRSSSVHTLLQIRRDSAKFSEELANLTAQLSAATNSPGTNSKRPSLSVPGTNDDNTPTIDQLLAETSVNQPILVSSTYLTVDSNAKKSVSPSIPHHRGRSRSADIRFSSLNSQEKKSLQNLGGTIPNLLVTHDSMQRLSNQKTNDDYHQQHHRHSTNLNVNYHPETLGRRVASLSKFDSTCQRIKDWITVTASSNVLNQDFIERPRFISTINMTEAAPMLNGRLKHINPFPFSNLKRDFPRLEQLYGELSAPHGNSHSGTHQQAILVDDHVRSVHNFASMQRTSVCSIASTMLAARSIRAHRPSTSSSIGSASQSGFRKRAPRLIDGMSQASFQIVSLDTEDSSSGSSSLTHQSVTLHVSLPGNPMPTCSSPMKKASTIRNLTKTSASNERKAMRVLLIIFSIFVILWTPFFVINLLSCFFTNIHPILISVSTWLGYCSSGANPIIYTIFSRSFRRAFVNILTCRKVMSSHRSQMFTPSCHSMSMSVGRKLSTVSRGPADLR